MSRARISIEWDRIELEYLAGEDSIREIADRYGISDTAIRKRAKLKGWVRPVRTSSRPRTSIDCELFAPPPAPAPPRSEPREAGEVADAGRDLVGRMMDELDAVTSHRGELEAVIYQATLGDEDDSRRNAMLKALSLQSRAGTMKTLSLALKTLNESSAPAGKKAARQDKAGEVAKAGRFSGLGPPSLKVV